MPDTDTIAIAILVLTGAVVAIWLIPWKQVIRTGIGLIAAVLIVIAVAQLNIDVHALLAVIVPDFGGTTP